MKAIADWFNQLNANGKGIVMVLGAYIVTMVVAVFIIAFAILFFIDTTNCGAVGRTLPVLWITIAVVFLASVLVVGVAAWKIYPNRTGRLVTVTIHGAAMLASYVVVAFGLMVVFNC